MTRKKFLSLVGTCTLLSFTACAGSFFRYVTPRPMFDPATTWQLDSGEPWLTEDGQPWSF